MTDLIIYLVKAAFINAVLLAFYYFVLRKTNRFRLMRIVLLLAMVLPLCLPLIPITYISSHSNNGLNTLSVALPAITYKSSSGIQWPSVTETCYYTVALMLFVGMLISIIMIFKKRKFASLLPTKYGEVYIHKDVRSPFSFFEWVFLSNNHINNPRLEMLLKHEFCHVKELHSIDRILSGIFRSFLWFSPFAHVTARRLVEVHEYQADANVIKTNIAPSEYSDLVLSFYLKEFSTLGVSNSFSFHIKKRIAMINQINIMNLRAGRIIFGLCFSILAVLAISFIQSAESPTRNNGSHSDLINIIPDGDTIPPYPIIDLNSFNKNSNEIIKDRQGQIKDDCVIISLNVDETGEPSDYKIYQSAGEKLDNAALSIVKNFKGWEPAKFQEKPVNYKLFYPITFPLDDFHKIEIKGGIAVDDQRLVTGKENLDKEQEKVQKERKMQKEQEMIQMEKEQVQKGQEREQKNIVKVQKEQELQLEQEKVKQAQVKNEENKTNQESDSKAQKKPGTNVYKVVDDPPKYPGGDQARADYLNSKIIYPAEARKKGIEGTVYLTFIIQADGSVTNVKVLRGINLELDKIAFEAVKSMPDWIPGKIKGKAVAVEFNIPIKFSLSSNKAK